MNITTIKKKIDEILDRYVSVSDIENTKCEPYVREKWLTTHKYWFDAEMNDAEAHAAIEKTFGIELPIHYELWEKSDDEIAELVFKLLRG